MTNNTKLKCLLAGFRGIVWGGAIVAGGLLATGCDTSPSQVPENVIVIPEDYDAPFDAQPGDTLILVMYQDDNGVPSDWQGRCFHAGGEPILNTRTNIATCEDVDF
jgi:hypothetical protein